MGYGMFTYIQYKKNQLNVGPVGKYKDIPYMHPMWFLVLFQPLPFFVSIEIFLHGILFSVSLNKQPPNGLGLGLLSHQLQEMIHGKLMTYSQVTRD